MQQESYQLNLYYVAYFNLCGWMLKYTPLIALLKRSIYYKNKKKNKKD